MSGAFPPPLPFEQYLATGQVAAAPTIWQALVLLVAALGVSFLCIAGVRRLPAGLRRWLDETTAPGRSVFEMATPSVIYGYLAPHWSRWYPGWYLRPGWVDHFGSRREGCGLVLLDSTAEEVQFRGLPLLAAPVLGVSPVVAVVVSTVYWAALYSISGLVRQLPIGLVYAWLWVTGAWPLAIALHAGTKLIAYLVCQRWAPSQVARPAPDSA